MNEASSSPGWDGQAFSNWLQSLTSLSPSSIAAAEIDIIELECRVLVRSEIVGDSMTRLFLQSLPESASFQIVSAAKWVPFEPAVIAVHVELMRRLGLVDQLGPDHFALSELGRRVRSGESSLAALGERRTFRFLDLRPVAAPVFVGMAESVSRSTCASPRDWNGLAAVQAAVARDEAWKRSAGFPAEFAGVVSVDPLLPDGWRDIPLVGFRRRVVVLAAINDPTHGDCWQVFQPDAGITTASLVPTGRLLASALTKPTEDLWFEAWRQWLVSRGVARDVAESCSIDFSGVIATVGIPKDWEGIRTLIASDEGWLYCDVAPIRFAMKLAAK